MTSGNIPEHIIMARTGSVSVRVSRSWCTATTGIDGESGDPATPGPVRGLVLDDVDHAHDEHLLWRSTYAATLEDDAVLATYLSADEVIMISPGSPTITFQATPISMIVGTPNDGFGRGDVPGASVGQRRRLRSRFALYSNDACATATACAAARSRRR